MQTSGLLERAAGTPGYALTELRFDTRLTRQKARIH